MNDDMSIIDAVITIDQYWQAFDLDYYAGNDLTDAQMIDEARKRLFWNTTEGEFFNPGDDPKNADDAQLYGMVFTNYSLQSPETRVYIDGDTIHFQFLVPDDQVDQYVRVVDDLEDLRVVDVFSVDDRNQGTLW